MNIKTNGFQEDHRYLEAQMGEHFVLKTKDLHINLAENEHETNKEMYYLPT